MKATVLVSRGYSRKTGYYHRANRDRTTLTSLGLETAIRRAYLTGDKEGWRRLVRAVSTLRQIAADDIIVIENYGALSVYVAMRLFIRRPNHRAVLVVHGSLAELREYRWAAVKRKAYSLIEKLSIRLLDRVFCVSQVMTAEFKRQYPAFSMKVLCSPNLPPADFYSAVRSAHAIGRRQIREQLSMPRRASILLYAGNTQVWQNISLLIATARELASLDGFHTVVLTTESEAMTRLFRAAGIPSAAFTIRVAQQHEVPAYLVAADWLFVVREENEINRVACPTKAVEYLISGTKLVTSAGLGDISRLVTELDAGIVVKMRPPIAPKALARAISAQASDGSGSSNQLPVPRTLPPPYERGNTERLFADVIRKNEAACG